MSRELKKSYQLGKLYDELFEAEKDCLADLLSNKKDLGPIFMGLYQADCSDDLEKLKDIWGRNAAKLADLSDTVPQAITWLVQYKDLIKFRLEDKRT